MVRVLYWWIGGITWRMGRSIFRRCNWRKAKEPRCWGGLGLRSCSWSRLGYRGSGWWGRTVTIEKRLFGRESVYKGGLVLEWGIRFGYHSGRRWRWSGVWKVGPKRGLAAIGFRILIGRRTVTIEKGGRRLILLYEVSPIALGYTSFHRAELYF